MAVNELNAATSKIYELLAANSVITTAVGTHPQSGVIQIYSEVAPQNSSFPYVVFRLLRANTKSPISGDHKSLVKTWWNIMAFDDIETFSRIAPIADAIEDIFMINQVHDDPVTIGASTKGMIMSAINDDGQQLRVMGSRVEMFLYDQNP